MVLASTGLAAEGPLQGAEVLKTDLMFVGAHPDDETGVAAVMARYAGQGRVVASVYCTRGEGGGNMVGTQAGAALGVLRETELRDCLRILGVRHVYFLDEEDFFYTESLAATLAKWEKEDVLGKLARVIRSLRPDVIVTMNPAPNPGQHGHHQAAGILATEAFAAAADPKRFPEQLEREGLEAWQVRKLYYSSSAEPNVKIRTDETLPNGDVPADLAAKALSQHRSQAFGNFANSPWLRRPSSFVLGKTAVKVSLPESDLFDSVRNAVDAHAQDQLAWKETNRAGFAFVPRPAISRFKVWAREHQVEHTASAFAADVPVIAGRENKVRLAVMNGGSMKPALTNEGWKVTEARKSGKVVYGNEYVVQPPADAREDVTLRVTSANDESAEVRLHPVPLATANRKNSIEFEITTDLVVQGRTDSPADLSGTFAVRYDQEYLHVRVVVRDDRVVSNIEPNDIKGHWRSDSVEICIDPNPGSEHTMGCFKIGIFPFDTTGKVRAARDADANQGPIERTAPGTKLNSQRSADGYAISISIPWSDIGVKPKRGTKLGFNVILYDGDKENAARGENINEARLAWSPRPGVQGRPEDWGRLLLE
ncbi:MAG TPA: PIG-L family deacetylase [Verrucomicrobiae bacterium]